MAETAEAIPQTEPIQATATTEAPVTTESQPQATTEPVKTETPAYEPVKPFTYQTEESKNPFDNISPSDFVKNYKGDKTELFKEVAKANDLDDFILGAVDHWKKTKDLTPYLEVKSTDWTKIPDNKVIEKKLREQYSNYELSDDQLGKLIAKEMRTKYMVGADPESESEDVELGQIQLKIDAAQYRAERIENQKNFKAPEVSTSQAAPAISYEEQVAQAHNQLVADPAVQQFLQSAKIQMGDTSSPYNYEDKTPKETLQILSDNNAYIYHIAQKTPDGKVVMSNGQPVLDKGLMVKIANYVKNHAEVEKGLIEYGKTLGKKAIIDENENVPTSIEKSQGSQTDSPSFWQEWAAKRKISQSQ